MQPFGTSMPRYITLGSELVTNGSMEAGNPPTAWNPWVDSPIMASVVDERTGGSGSKSLDLTISAGQTGATAAQIVTTEASKTYELSFWYKNINAVGVIFSIYDNAFNVLLNMLSLNSTSWTYETARFTTTLTGDTYILPIVGGAEGQHGRVDDISLREVLNP